MKILHDFWKFLSTWGISILVWIVVSYEIYILWPRIVQIVESYLGLELSIILHL